MKISLFKIGFFAFIISIVNAQKACPPNLFKEADRAFAEMVLYGNRGVGWPRDESDIANLCG